MFPHQLPGSIPDDDFDSLTLKTSYGRFTDLQLRMIAELVTWWANRRVVDDSNEPLMTLIGGVDFRGTARTTGTTPAVATLNRPPTPDPAPGVGRSYFVQALGIPDPDSAGEVYSLTGLCHFYYDGSSWLTRYTTTGRAPAATTDTELRTALELGTGTPQILIVGVTGLTIDWTLNISMIEL